MSFAGSRRRPPAISPRVVAHVGLIAILILVVGFVWLRVVDTLTADVQRPRPVGTPKALGWGDHAFSNKAQLQLWLKQRGISYEVWARRHAAAVAVLEHRRFVPQPARSEPSPAAATQSTAAPTTTPQRQAVAKPAKTEPTTTNQAAGAGERRAAGPSAQTGGDSGGAAGAAIWALALLLGAIALAPTRVLVRVGGLRMGASHRTYLAAAAASIIVAMAVASMGS